LNVVENHRAALPKVVQQQCVGEVGIFIFFWYPVPSGCRTAINNYYKIGLFSQSYSIKKETHEGVF